MAKIILSESQLKRLIDNTLTEQAIPAVGADMPLSSILNATGGVANSLYGGYKSGVDKIANALNPSGGMASGMSNAMSKIGGGVASGMSNAMSNIANKTNLAARNAALMKPGETASDYFLNPDGSIKVTDLDPVTVSAKRIKPNTPPLPQVKPPTVPGVQIPAGVKPTSGTPAAPTASTPPAAPAQPLAGQTAPVQPTATSVASGPTNPQAQAATKPSMSGEQMHNLLMQKGLINGFNDLDGYENRRIVYKGAPLSPEQLNTLSTYLQDKGYGKRFSQVGDKRYGQKYVWVKGGSALPSDMAV